MKFEGAVLSVVDAEGQTPGAGGLAGKYSQGRKVAGRVFIGLSGLMLLGACALPPQGVSREQISAYEAAVASIGCEMAHESDYLPVELQAGLSRQQALDITAYEIAAGRAVRLSDGGVKLTTGACA